MTRSRIAIDATILSPTGSGLNSLTRELVKELMAAHDNYYTYTTLPEVLPPHEGRVLKASERLSQYGFKGNLLRLLWHQFILPLSLLHKRARIFYSTLPEGMLMPVCKQVITIADIIPLVYPESAPRLAYYYKWVLPRLIRASAAIITISEWTKKDLELHCGALNRPVHVVYPGYDKSLFRPPAGEEVKRVMTRYELDKYVLCVGETRPYKNTRRLVEAFARAGVADFQLAIAGKINRLDTELLELPRRLGIGDRVKFLGYVPDGDLAGLYGGAAVFAFPSLYEGFGLPPLEAMACGCPVVVSDAASLPEVCGEAAVYVDPTSVGDISRGIRLVATDPELRRKLRERGLARAGEFSYERAAAEISRILDQLK